jgi:hypothetical protein
MLPVKRIALAILVALFVAWTWVGTWYSWQRPLSNHQDAVIEASSRPPASPEAAQKREELSIQRDIARFNHQLVIATWVIGVVGMVTGVVLFFTLRVTQKAADHIPRTERAYLFVNPTNIAMSLPGRYTTFDICVDNAGKTPALLKQIHLVITQAPPLGNPQYPNAQIVLTDLYINAGVRREKLPIVGDRANWVTPFFVYGFLIYTDIFRETHTSHFCARILPTHQNFEIAGGEAWNDWD